MSDLSSPTRPRVGGAAGFGSTMASNTGVGGTESSPSSYQADAARYDSLKGSSINRGVDRMNSNAALQSELPMGATDAIASARSYGRTGDSNTMPAEQNPDGGFTVHKPEASSYSTGSHGSTTGSYGTTSGSNQGSTSSNLAARASETYESAKNTAADVANRATNSAQRTYDQVPSTSQLQQGKTGGSGTSLEDSAHRYYNSVANHPTVQNLATTSKRMHRQYIQPATDRVLTEQTQQHLYGYLQRLGSMIHNLRAKYDRSFLEFGRDVVHTSATPRILGLITWLLTFELVLPLFYFNQAEARVVMAAAIGTIMAIHAIWYALGGQIRPLILGGFAVQVPLFLYLMFSGGLGGGYASGKFQA